MSNHPLERRPGSWLAAFVALVGAVALGYQVSQAEHAPGCDVAYAVHLPAPLPTPEPAVVAEIVADPGVDISVDPPTADQPARVHLSYYGDDQSRLVAVSRAASRIAYESRIVPPKDRTVEDRLYAIDVKLVELEREHPLGGGAGRNRLLAEREVLLAGDEAPRPRVERLRAIRNSTPAWAPWVVPGVLLAAFFASLARLMSPWTGGRLQTQSEARQALALPAREVELRPRPWAA